MCSAASAAPSRAWARRSMSSTTTPKAPILRLSGNVVNAIVAEAAYERRDRGDATDRRISAGASQHHGGAGASWRRTLREFAQYPESARHDAGNSAASSPAIGTHHGTCSRRWLASGSGDWAPPRVTFSELTLPDDLPVSLPSDLVRQRPDILVAEAQLHVASAQIGVATAAMFPSFTLNANYGWNSTSLSTLFGSSAAFWTLGASLATPVIQGPTLWYQRKAAIDAYQQALANYRQTVLAAFAQVADALDALQHDAQTLSAQSQALSAAAEALHLIQSKLSRRAPSTTYRC